MRRFGGTFLIFLILFLAAPFAKATITSWNCDDDGDGAIVMDTPVMTDLGGGEYELSMAGVQYWYPAHVEGDFTATPDDPIVRFIEDIENDTTFAWTDYHIAIGMSNEFSILSTGLMMPDGWTAVITAPSSGQPLPNGGTGWLGMIDYYMDSGLPVAIGDIGTFGFKISFVGSIAFCTEQIPTPEPATIMMLGLGALSVIRRKKA